MRTFLLVMLAGAAGTAIRYLMALALGGHGRFPIATFAVNVTGSFLIGFVVPWAMRHAWPGPVLTIVTTGFLGGFTTYSAFNYDLTVMATGGHAFRALIYAAATVCICFLAGLAGLQLGK